MTTISRNTVSFCIRKSSLFQKPLPIKVQRLQRRTNMLLVKCKFSKQTLRSPKEEIDESKTLVDSKISLNKKVLTRTLRKCKNPEEVLFIIRKNKQEMDCINISTAFVSAAYIIQQRNRRQNSLSLDTIRSIYLELFSLTEQQVDQMQHQAVANSLWSIGKLVDIFGYKLIKEDRVKATFNKLCERTLCEVDKMSVQGISNSLWAMGKLKYQHEKYIKALVQAIYKQSCTYPQHISNMLWALAVLEHEDVQITNHLVNCASNFITEMSAQQIANSLWALQQLRYYDKNFVDLAEQQIQSCGSQSITCQNISNILLAFAEFGMCCKENVVSNLLKKFVDNIGQDVQAYTNSIQRTSTVKER
eukprot:TRINITY_DN6447_c0_g2_i1.p1 TRINITY_DN6447_c0_g2~~TRINITY_DN6447_c0_g2_i1.p1  ORF type:complete len:360 (-),score=8.33 TRINITY_DN6447_c0_g2_i1:30-1109(-)